jgi:hypothetical protein
MRSSRRYCDKVVDEVSRHSGVATATPHTTWKNRGITLPAGTMLIFRMGVVCRYSGPFENGL